jgi:hypothetical protein
MLTFLTGSACLPWIAFEISKAKILEMLLGFMITNGVNINLHLDSGRGSAVPVLSL